MVTLNNQYSFEMKQLTIFSVVMNLWKHSVPVEWNVLGDQALHETWFDFWLSLSSINPCQALNLKQEVIMSGKLNTSDTFCNHPKQTSVLQVWRLRAKFTLFVIFLLQCCEFWFPVYINRIKFCSHYSGLLNNTSAAIS